MSIISIIDNQIIDENIQKSINNVINIYNIYKNNSYMKNKIHNYVCNINNVMQKILIEKEERDKQREKMNKHHQIEVLRILKQYKNVVLNENSNGVFINLIDLDKDIISTLYKYIIYVDNQTTNINNIEIQKEQLEKEFFTPLIE